MTRFIGMQRYSLRWLLTLLMLAGIVLSVGISSGLSIRDAKVQIEELFDAQMLQSVKILELFYHNEVDRQGVPPTPQILHVADSQISSFAEKANTLRLAYEHKLAFQIWNQTKQLLVLSDNIGHQPITAFDEGYHKTTINGELWHVFSYFSTKEHVWIMTAQQDEVRQELISQMVRNSILVPLLVVPLTLALISLLLYLLFRPLKAFERELLSRAANDLTPLTMPLPKELIPVRGALNHYIGSIAGFIARERRFSADAAHELKTPLAVIKLHQQGLESFVGNAPQCHLHLQAINAGVAHMSHMVEQLLLLARVDSLNELKVQPHGLLSMVEDALNQLMPQITDYEWMIDVDPPLQLICDRFYLVLVLKNIIENACKYSEVETQITISAQQVHKGIEIRVADRGQGMTPEQILSATERFYRVNENEGIGAGLGLSICQHIIKLHQGRLTIQPRAQGGLIVCMFIPQ